VPEPFLSEAWIAAARKIRDRHGDVPSPTIHVRVNLTVTETPFPDTPTLMAHIDTTQGSTGIELGHVDAPHVSLTTDYDTARGLFVAQDQALAMQAFMAGKIRVQGDLSKLLALQSAPQDPEVAAIAASIAQEITAITASASPASASPASARRGLASGGSGVRT
jgi:hypothetical protein